MVLQLNMIFGNVKNYFPIGCQNYNVVIVLLIFEPINKEKTLTTEMW